MAEGVSKSEIGTDIESSEHEAAHRLYSECQ